MTALIYHQDRRLHNRRVDAPRTLLCGMSANIYYHHTTVTACEERRASAPTLLGPYFPTTVPYFKVLTPEESATWRAFVASFSDIDLE